MGAIDTDIAARDDGLVVGRIPTALHAAVSIGCCCCHNIWWRHRRSHHWRRHRVLSRSRAHVAGGWDGCNSGLLGLPDVSNGPKKKGE